MTDQQPTPGRLWRWIDRHSNAPDMTFALALTGVIATFIAAIAGLLETANVATFAALFGGLFATSGVLSARQQAKDTPPPPPQQLPVPPAPTPAPTPTPPDPPVGAA